MKLSKRITNTIIGLVIVLIFTIPLIINTLLRIENRFIVGKLPDWIGFYGGYLGGIIGASAVIVIGVIQLKLSEKLAEKSFNKSISLQRNSIKEEKYLNIKLKYFPVIISTLNDTINNGVTISTLLTNLCNSASELKLTSELLSNKKKELLKLTGKLGGNSKNINTHLRNHEILLQDKYDKGRDICNHISNLTDLTLLIYDELDFEMNDMGDYVKPSKNTILYLNNDLSKERIKNIDDILVLIMIYNKEMQNFTYGELVKVDYED